jgi:1-deoxy-D-xylulose 5-phosphate reductoisomerase
MTLNLLHDPNASTHLAILGSTGSVGTSTLDVVARIRTASRSSASRAPPVDELVAQCLRFRPRGGRGAGPSAGAALRAALAARPAHRGAGRPQALCDWPRPRSTA